MDLGMPTLIELNSLRECTSLCYALGLQFVELNMNMPEYQMDRFSVEEAEECQKRYGIYYTLHLEENLNVCDMNPLISGAYMETVKWAARLARRLNMPIINMHLADGIYFTLPDQKIYLYDRYRDTYMEKIREFRKECEEELQDTDIKICIENCGGFPEFARQAIDYLLESPFFALTWDIGHSHAAGGRDEEFIQQRIHKLVHMHIHDAIGSWNHLPLGYGEIRIREKLQLAQKQGCRCVLEIKTVEALKSSVPQTVL